MNVFMHSMYICRAEQETIWSILTKLRHIICNLDQNRCTRKNLENCEKQPHFRQKTT